MQKLFGTVAFQAVSGRKLKREGTENSRSIYSATDNSQPKTVIHKDKQATQTYHNTSIHSPLSRVRYKEFRGRRSRRSRGTCTSVKPWGKWGMIWKIDWTSWMDDLFRLIVDPTHHPFHPFLKRLWFRWRCHRSEQSWVPWLRFWSSNCQRHREVVKELGNAAMQHFLRLTWSYRGHCTLVWKHWNLICECWNPIIILSFEWVQRIMWNILRKK